MAVMTAYCDASGSHSTEAVAVGCIMASPKRWKEFDERWSECLAAHGVSAMHMKDFAHSRGEFESWRDDEFKRRRFLNGLLWIIEQTLEYAASSAVYIKAYKQLDSVYALNESMRPYTMASLSCWQRLRCGRMRWDIT
jgi:hypothetical protein